MLVCSNLQSSNYRESFLEHENNANVAEAIGKVLLFVMMKYEISNMKIDSVR